MEIGADGLVFHPYLNGELTPYANPRPCADCTKLMAEKLCAALGASRGLVDMNKNSYDKQIGLTGKTVSSKKYIAIGISGTV